MKESQSGQLVCELCGRPILGEPSKLTLYETDGIAVAGFFCADSAGCRRAAWERLSGLCTALEEAVWAYGERTEELIRRFFPEEVVEWANEIAGAGVEPEGSAYETE